MSLFAPIAAWTALALVVTITPGPDTLLVAGNAKRRGVSAAMATVAGIVTGGVVYAALCGFGFLSLLIAVPALYWVVKILGATYLALIGVLMIRDAVRPRAEIIADVEPSRKRFGAASPFAQGLLTNTLNPKIAVFYLAALPQFTGRGPDAPLIGVLLIAIHYAMGGAWLSGIALTAAKAGGAVRSSPAYRWLNGAIGVFLVGVAGKVAFDRR